MLRKLIDWLHIRIVMTLEELKQKYLHFQERFFKAGKVKKQLKALDACLAQMDDPFTFEVTIYSYMNDKAVTFDTDKPDEKMCDHMRQAIGQLKRIHLDKLHELGVTE